MKCSNTPSESVLANTAQIVEPINEALVVTLL